MKRDGKINYSMERVVERGINFIWWLSLMVDLGQVPQNPKHPNPQHPEKVKRKEDKRKG